jgi:hypothetical protein
VQEFHPASDKRPFTGPSISPSSLAQASPLRRKSPQVLFRHAPCSSVIPILWAINICCYSFTWLSLRASTSHRLLQICWWHPNNIQCSKTKTGNTPNEFNTIHPKIRFIIENDAQKNISYLDIAIKRENNKLVFRIYRKPTTTDFTIPSTSCHPQEHKKISYKLPYEYSLPPPPK